MKHLILIIVTGITVNTQAQITIEANDLGVPGDTFRMSLADTLVDFNPLETGADQHWDYSDVSVKAQMVDTLVLMSQVQQAFQFVFFGKANYGVSTSFSLPGNFFDTISMNVGYNFFNKNNNRLSRVGQGYVIQDAPLPVLYLHPDVIYNFPLNYGDKDTSASSSILFIPNVGGIYTDITRVTEVDGYGTLITALDTFDALRVRSEITRRDSIVYEGNSQVITSTTVEYKWLADNTGVPAMQVNTQKIGPIEIVSLVRFKDRYRSISPTGIQKMESNEPIVYPTLVRPGENLYLENNGSLNIDAINIFDMAGQKVTIDWTAGMLTIKIPSDTENGIYILKAHAKEKVFITRFVVSR